jgi:hypothetical protein
MRFRLDGGLHRQDDRTYKKGDVIETNLELDKMFARTGKFTRLQEETRSPDNGGEQAMALPASQHGTDVTSVVNAGLLETSIRVFQRGSWFYVVDVATGDRLNDKALKRDQVGHFVAQYLEN